MKVLGRPEWQVCNFSLAEVMQNLEYSRGTSPNTTDAEVVYKRGITYLDTVGQEQLFICGTGFGPFNASTGNQVDDVTYGKVVGADEDGLAIFHESVQFRAVDCEVAVSHRVIRCFTAGGVGARLQARVTIARQISLPSAARLSYKPPKILLTVVSATGTGGAAAGEAPTAGNNV